MRISWRPSGGKGGPSRRGRGEYELAGSQGTITKDQLFEHEFLFELSPDLLVKSRATARLDNGKPRIRLLEIVRGLHPTSILASALLLPKPVRSLSSASTGALFVRNGGYVLHDVDIDVARLGSSEVTIRPVRLRLRSGDGIEKQVDHVRRFSQLTTAWTAAQTAQGPAATLLLAHRDAVESGDAKRILNVGTEIQRAYGTDTDPLQAIAHAVGLVIGSSEPDPEASGDDPESDVDNVTINEAKARALRKWRLQAMRDAGARKFSRDVKRAYSYTCAVMGHHLPPVNEVSQVPGVDAAHIRPWSQTNLNSIDNGICLCKMCHWAFDNGILSISKPGRSYVAEIPTVIQASLSEAEFDVSWLEPFLGPIPSDHFPEDERLRPNPAYLETVNDWLSSSPL